MRRSEESPGSPPSPGSPRPFRSKSEGEDGSERNPECDRYGSEDNCDSDSGGANNQNRRCSSYAPDPEQDSGQGDSDVESLSHRRQREDSDISATGPPRKAMRVEGFEGRPRARDFEADVQDVLSAVIAHYHADLSTKNAYPDMATKTNWARAAWKAGCHDKDVEITLNSDILHLVSEITASFACIQSGNLRRLHRAPVTFAGR